MRTIENKTNTMLRLEREYGVNVEELLRYLYVTKEMTINQIGKELILSDGIIFKWLNLANITTRKISWNNRLNKKKGEGNNDNTNKTNYGNKN